MKTYASKFSAQRGARAAGHAVEAVRIEKTPKGFVWRLIAPQPVKPAPALVGPDPARVTPAPVVPASAPTAASSSRRMRFAAIEATARTGVLPEPPDFSAATHARFRGKLARLADLAAAGDVEALRAFEINPVSSSPKAMARYRDLCVIALAARNG